MKRVWLIGCAGALFPVLALGVGWWQYASLPPSVSIPAQNLPARNARDGYLAAAALVVSPQGGALSAGTPAERAALLARNDRALHLLRRSLALPFCEPRTAPGTPVPAGTYSRYRQLVRLLVLEAEVYGDRGEWGRAAQSGLDAVEFGSSLSHGAPLIGMLMGVACQAIGRGSIRDTLPHLAPAEAKAAAARLQGIASTEVSFADVLTEEKYVAQLSLLNLPPSILLATPVAAGSGARRPLFAWPMTRRRAIANLARAMDEMAANSRKPYASRPPAPAVPLDILTQIVVPVWTGGYFAYTRNRTANALLLVELGLQAYRGDHRCYPDRLDQLVPAYLPAIPGDPFALNGPPRYRRAGGRYLLYSLGPDGKDDGGKPIWNPGVHHQAGIVEDDSKGDWVAGVNR